MGTLHYSTDAYAFDDRTLAHLKTAIAHKFRRQESFLLSWEKEPSEGSGRNSLWLSPNVPIAFRFHGGRPPALNPLWVKALLDLANSPRGLVVLTEQQAEEHARRQAEKLQGVESA